jgi:hypothetical protein
METKIDYPNIPELEAETKAAFIKAQVRAHNHIAEPAKTTRVELAQAKILLRKSNGRQRLLTTIFKTAIFKSWFHRS